MIKFGTSRKDPPSQSFTPAVSDDDFDVPPSTIPPQQQLPPPRVVQPPVRTAARENELNAFLGKGCSFEGKLTFEGRVRIDGKFTGEIFSTDTLEIGPDAEIEAEINVATLVIAGRVTGNVIAKSRCDLRHPASVVGNITAPVITMEEGVRFDGHMSMTGALDHMMSRNFSKKTTAPTTETSPTMIAQAPNAAGVVRRNVAPPRDPSDLLKPVP